LYKSVLLKSNNYLPIERPTAQVPFYISDVLSSDSLNSWLSPNYSAIEGVSPCSCAVSPQASSPSSFLIYTLAFRVVAGYAKRKTPINLGGVCPVGMGNFKQSPREDFSPIV
jgi:hypothetical protein